MNKEKKFATYLAGAFCPFKAMEDWRDYVILNTKNKKIKFYDPRIESIQLCPATFTMDDAEGVLNSDILLHFRRRGYEDDGASWEQGIAFACNLLNARELDVKPKLIIYADETSVPFPLHFGSANVTFNNLETAVRFLNSIKSLEKKDFIDDYLKLLDIERVGGKK